VLAFLLLASLAWGSTVEFTHHHGARTRAVESTLGFTQSSDTDQATATRIQPSNPNGTSSNSQSGADCLLCQLHQNLSATVIDHAPGIEPTKVRGFNAPTSDVFELPAFMARSQGRAPPSIL
jgi:hypothetical protein